MQFVKACLPLQVKTENSNLRTKRGEWIVHVCVYLLQEGELLGYVLCAVFILAEGELLLAVQADTGKVVH